ncbi:MAG: hypothetical protein ACSHYF_15350 [Verrucomicrobiaceae bacterium]
MQNEPNLWESKPDILAKQQQIALAVIHGQADPIVNFSQGEHAHGIFLAMGYPKLRFFAPEKLGHQFGLSPVPDALEWLDAMTGHDHASAIKLTKTWGREKEWGWAHQAALAIPADSRESRSAQSIIAAIEKQASDATATMKASLDSKSPREWIPEWFEFRRQFGATQAAKELVTAYDAAREKERAQATQLFRQASALGRAKKPDEMKETLEKLLTDTPHTYHTWYALRWTREK